MTRSIHRSRWRIDIDLRPDVEAPLPMTEIARLVARALDAVSAPSPASLGVILSDDVELAQLNAQHLGMNGPTDVLSFPLLPPEGFAPGADAPSEPRPPRSRLHLGDCILSVERAAAQASEGRGGQTGNVRWSVADEVRLLIVHGVLHICGRDHAEPDEAAEMRALERDLLERHALRK